MGLHVNDNAVWAGLFCLIAAAFAFAAYYLLERKRIAVQEKWQISRFEQEMLTVPRASWDGNQYDWTPESLAYLADPYASGGPAATAPMPVLPDWHPSGPMPAQRQVRYAHAGPQFTPHPAAQDPDDFMAKLKADNAAFLARLALRQVAGGGPTGRAR